MQELVEYVAQAVVDQPEAVHVHREEGRDRVVLYLEVAPSDVGKVIGRQGRVAQAMRALLKVASAREGKRGILEIN